jgi:hypothetical protein
MVVGLIGLICAFAALDHFENYKSHQAAWGWTRTAGESLPTIEKAPQLMTSMWRIGPNTRWTADDPATQLYIRPISGAGLGLSLAAKADEGLWIWISDDSPATATIHGEPLTCMGQLHPPQTVEAVELTAQDESVLVSWGDTTMVCPHTAKSAAIPNATASIQTRDHSVSLRSIGRNRRSDGVPLSPLWWMSGMMVGGMCFMLLFDALIAAFRQIRSTLQAPRHWLK